jgi:transposase
MVKRIFILTPTEASILEKILKTCTDDPTCDRLQAVLWYGTGLPAAEITARLGCSRSSLMSWCQAYRTSGVTGLLDRRLGGNNARLSPEQITELKEHLRTLTPRDVFSRKAATPVGLEWTVPDLYRLLRMWYGVTYRSRTSYYNLFDRLGLKAPREKNEVYQSEPLHAVQGAEFL